MSDRDMYIKQLEEKLTDVVRGTGRTTVCMSVLDLATIVNLLKESQTQKHGHWIVSGEPPLMIKTCSECGVRIFHHSGSELEKFCAWCGAKMDGVKQ